MGYMKAAVVVSCRNCIIQGIHKTVADDVVGPWLAYRSVVPKIERLNPQRGELSISLQH